MPVRLRDDTDTKALCFKGSPNHGHAKTGMIDVGIAGDDDDVTAVPSQGCHLSTRRRQKLGRSKAAGPIGPIAGDGFRESLELRHVDGHVHRGRWVAARHNSREPAILDVTHTFGTACPEAQKSYGQKKATRRWLFAVARR